jgi:hypothetical protein
MVRHLPKLLKPAMVPGSLALLSIAGCSPTRVESLHDSLVRALTLDDALVCPTFNVTPDTIQILTNQRTYPLGGGNFLRVPRDAVANDGDYEVMPIANSKNERVAGFRIRPLAGADADFDEPVELEISYQGCTVDESKRLVILRNNGVNSSSLGGAKSKAKDYVKAFTEGFSEFAIAI